MVMVSLHKEETESFGKMAKNHIWNCKHQLLNPLLLFISKLLYLNYLQKHTSNPSSDIVHIFVTENKYRGEKNMVYKISIFGCFG